ncbi:MAG: TonB-dependent receptor, partial [Tannerella sp.]|nr:TonB-dependent receptor [Tannerella sp.]
MKSILFSVILLLCASQAVGQDADKVSTRYRVSGYIIDDETSERLSDTYVRIGKETTFTNNYGYFSLRVEEGRQEIYASCTGCTPYEEEVRIAGDTMLTIRLRTGVELAEVTVTAPQQHIGSSGLGTARINLSQLYLSPLFLGERDVIKSIQALPGISGGMEGSSNVVIRGGTYDQTLFLMDDAPVYSQNHTFGFFSIFNPDALLSADIYKGGVPTVYGNRMSGVASIALKDGNMRSHRGSVSLGLLASSLSAEGPIVKDRASYLFTARRSFTDLLMQGLMKLMTSDGGYSAVLLSFWDVNGKITWNINDRTRLSAGIYTGNDMLGAENETEISRYDDGEYKSTSAYDRFGRGWKNTTASLRLTSDIRRNAFLSSSLYYSQLDNYDSYNIKSDNYLFSQRKAMRMQEMGWRTSFEQKMSNANTLFAGFDVSYQHYRPELLTSEASNGDNLKIDNYRPLHLLTVSIFASDEWRYGRWTFVPGIRLSSYRTKDQNKQAIEPRLKISMQANDVNRLMLAYDRMTQPVHSINEMAYAESADYWLPFREDRLP